MVSLSFGLKMNIIPVHSTSYYYDSDDKLLTEKSKLAAQIALIDQILLDRNQKDDSQSFKNAGLVIKHTCVLL